jgi:hypothetical protein
VPFISLKQKRQGYNAFRVPSKKDVTLALSLVLVLPSHNVESLQWISRVTLALLFYSSKQECDLDLIELDRT